MAFSARSCLHATATHHPAAYSFQFPVSSSFPTLNARTQRRHTARTYQKVRMASPAATSNEPGSGSGASGLTDAQLEQCRAWGVEVRPSTLGPAAGLGLFTTTARKPGERIVAYDGLLVKWDPATQKRAPEGPYVLALSKHWFIDGCDPSSGVGRFANTCRPHERAPGAHKHLNARYSVSSSKHTASIVASRSIAAGCEIFLAYGSSYRWFPSLATEA